MKPHFPTFASALAALWLAPAAWAEVREFTDVDGRTITAQLVEAKNDAVTLKLGDGRNVDVPLARLSEADREYVGAQGERATSEAKAVNEAFGLEAFGAATLSSTDAKAMAEAMMLPQESSTPTGDSWRLYAAVRKKDYKLFGAVPYSVALYSNADGNVTSVSIVFANKGDFGSTAGFGEDHFNGTGGPSASSLEEAMRHDEKLIESALTRALGEGTSQRFGDTAVRRTVRRWDWNGHAFLLSFVEGEYVSMEIVPPAVADSGGRSAREADAAVKQRLESSVVREDNGDVWISGIPMVDQGPKGYCVPATFERAMRKMGIEADMYLLAMVGQSSAGGGTSVELLLDNLKSQVYAKGRRVKDVDMKKLRIRDVKRYIDSGSPLLWRMCSMPDYNKAADENTKRRGKPGHEDWLAEIRTKFEGRDEAAGNYHLCMIIGYNEQTNELAVSDSWGKRYELRWVPVEVAAWANNGRCVIIQP